MTAGARTPIGRADDVIPVFPRPEIGVRVTYGGDRKVTFNAFVDGRTAVLENAVFVITRLQEFKFAPTHTHDVIGTKVRVSMLATRSIVGTPKRRTFVGLEHIEFPDG